MSDERSPLLQDEPDNIVYEIEAQRSLSPSSSSSNSNVPTPLPWKSLLILQMQTASQPLAFEVIFPFVNQMILEIGVVNDPEQVGFYSGLIESIFSVMSLLTILPASHLADIIGRKPVILVGLSGLAVSVSCFGMSKSFLSMIISRCLSGALGGVWACTKVMTAELTDKTNQARAFQGTMVAYRIGQVVGLPLGGLLAHPERNIPIFRTPFWYEYPFALPCFVAAGFTALSVALGYFFLGETLQKQNTDSSSSTNKPQAYGATQQLTDEGGAAAGCHGNPLVLKEVKKNKPSYRAVLTRPIISVMISNFFLCFASETLFAVFPLFSFTPIASGGLGMSEAAIGTQMAVRSLLHIGILPFYPKIHKYCRTTLRTHRVIMWTWPLSVVCIPFLNVLARVNGNDTWMMNAALLAFFFIWSLSGIAWLTQSILTTDAAPSAEALSTVNGLMQLTIALPQAISPAFVTSLFAFSIKSGIAGGHLIWIVLFFITIYGGIQSMTLQEAETSWRD
ncbi:hypothetical protein M422DRAFT_230020 [Sphaerobolus stellatus SS14]|uniref:Major facilitator superfamily (MFS) profile domain-containing protein n=1 Tax=Sphaerobolus stellatus (strain SS14) TaxID=990650 RepID=A0A0C9VRM4_SPHS4|nr:hypothetical protein M422DRAFT_230020 [Sphaerobolus stellatus SS14]